MTQAEIKERRQRGRPRNVQPAMVMVTLPAATLRMIEKNNEWIEDQMHSGAVDEKRYMSAASAAKFLDMSKSNLLNYLKEEIGYVKFKREIRFDRVNLIEFMERRKIKKAVGAAK